MRRRYNKNTYKVNTDRGRYAVTLDRLKNGVNGNPRFSANVLVLEVFGERMDDSFIFTANYTFNGHYMSEIDEARFIVEHYEDEVQKGE